MISLQNLGEKFWLGADKGGRDILGQLIIGARNSLNIAIAVTLITSFIGVVIGLVTGYFGGWIDNIFMRIIDFFITIPSLMIIIVFVSIIPKYTILDFILIMSLFLWVGTARLIRSKALSESRRDYISASKTLGTRNLAIIFKEMMPNLSSILIVEMTLNFAGNVGLETGLSFLGFGLPPSTPSLGTLVSYATDPFHYGECMVELVTSSNTYLTTYASDQLCWSGHSTICRCTSTTWLKTVIRRKSV